MIPKGKPFDVASDVDDLSEKHVFVTGGTSGLGRASLIAIAAHGPAVVYFTGRNRDHAVSLIHELGIRYPDVKAVFVPMDHARLSTIAGALKKLDKVERLDVLMCNAGTMACPPNRSPDGYDIQFAVNSVSHAMIVRCLLPALLRTRERYSDDVRIIVQTSEAYMLHPPGGMDVHSLKLGPKMAMPWTIDRLLPWGGEWMRFAVSQLANIWLVSELAGRYPQLTSVAVMPSISDTRLIRTRSLLNRMLIHTAETIRSPEEGCRTQVWAAASKRYSLYNGMYYQAVATEGWHARESQNEEKARELWNWMDRELRSLVVTL